MSVISEILLSLGWVILLCIIWTLFVFGTSIAWHLGKMFAEVERQKALFLWVSQNKKRAEEMGWDIENPNEVKHETKHKKPKR
jgi:hypothetical protein